MVFPNCSKSILLGCAFLVIKVIECFFGNPTASNAYLKVTKKYFGKLKKFRLDCLLLAVLINGLYIYYWNTYTYIYIVFQVRFTLQTIENP